MKPKLIRMPALALLSLIPLLILGCGGGGGGGGGGGPQVNDVPPNLNGLTVPTGFNSAGFPVTGSQLTLPGFTAAKKTVLGFVNTGVAPTTGGVSATIGVPASVRGKKVMSAKNSFSHPAHGATFNQWLRQCTRGKPIVRTDGPLGKRIPALRADALNFQTTFKMTSGPGSPILIPATCRKVTTLSNGGSTYFYLDDSDIFDATATPLIDTLAGYWTNTIYAKNREIFGEEPPATFNGITPGNDITILLSSRVKNLGIDLAGFFYPGDLYPKAQFSDSNERKMFYINYDPKGLTTITIASTIAHEFQHMINFYQRKVKGLDEETWLNEAMSGYAEHVCGFKLSTNNQSKALQVNMYFDKVNSTGLTDWKEENENYGLVYLFGTWLGQNFGNQGVVRPLLTSSSTGRLAVQEFAAMEFAKVMAQWALAIYVNDTTGKTVYGYSDMDLKQTYGYGPGLADVTITGPKVTPNQGFPFSSGSVLVSPGAVYFVELSGGNGSVLNMSFSGGTSIFEIHQ